MPPFCLTMPSPSLCSHSCLPTPFPLADRGMGHSLDMGQSDKGNGEGIELRALHRAGEKVGSGQ